MSPLSSINVIFSLICVWYISVLSCIVADQATLYADMCSQSVQDFKNMV